MLMVYTFLEDLWFFFIFLFYFLLILFVVNFVIHWNEKALGSHFFPIPIPPPTSLPTLSLQVLPEHQVNKPWNITQPLKRSLILNKEDPFRKKWNDHCVSFWGCQNRVPQIEDWGIRNWPRGPGGRRLTGSFRACGRMCQPLSWLLLPSCSLVSPQPLPLSSVCFFVQISLTLLQYDLISTSCTCYNPIPK